MSGFSAAGLARLAEVAASHVGPDRVPGLVALVASGDEVKVEALGSLAIDGPPTQRDSLFRIASTTKPITGAVTMALVDEGLLGLDEPVSRLLPELASPRVLRQMDGSLDDTVPATRAITVRDLLTFTFGWGMHVEMFMSPTPWPVMVAAADAQLAAIGAPEPGLPLGPDEWIERLGSLPLLAKPGERWLYNTSASVLGVLCQRAASAQSYGDVLRSRVFEPLGMTDTGFATTAVDRFATAYQNTPDGLQLWDPPDGKWARQPAFEDGAGGLVSTVDDLLAFARMFLRDGAPALSAGSVAAMTRDQVTAASEARSWWIRCATSWSSC